MTKLEKVLKYVHFRGNFTWKQFNKTMKCTYPSSETTYLSTLVRARYVEKIGRGKYQVNICPSIQMSYRELRNEASIRSVGYSSSTPLYYLDFNNRLVKRQS